MWFALKKFDVPIEVICHLGRVKDQAIFSRKNAEPPDRMLGRQLLLQRFFWQVRPVNLVRRRAAAIFSARNLQMTVHNLWRRQPLLSVCLLAIVVRIAWLLVAHVGLAFMVAPGRFAHVDLWQRPYQCTAWQSIDMWVRWDAHFYTLIAQDGYGTDLAGLRAAFFPLYPLVVRALRAMWPMQTYVAALLVNNLCDVGAWYAFAHLARRRLGIVRGGWALLAFAAFPTRNFGFSAYTEGLFLLLCVLAYLAYERHHAWLCALTCALASATRPPGIFCGLALFADNLWQRHGGLVNGREALRLGLASCAAPAGLLLYMIFLQARFGDALAFLRLQAVWGRGWHGPWSTWLAHGEPLDHLAMWGAALGCALGMKRGVPLRDTLLIGCGIVVPMLSGRVVSMARFVGVLFPLFLLVAGSCAKARWRYFGLAIGFSILMAFKVGQGAKVI